MDSWYDFAHSCEETVSDAFAKLGRTVSRYPYRFIVGVLVVSILCMLGILKMEVLTSTSALWTPQNSKTKRDIEYIENYFETNQRSGSLIFEGKSDDGFNVINLATMEQIWDAHEDVVSTVTGKGLTWNQLCAQRDLSGSCFVNGVTQFFSNNRTFYNEVVQSDEDLIDYISVLVYPAGMAVGREFIFGNYEVDSSNRIVFAEGTKQVYGLMSQTNYGKSVNFEENFIVLVEEFPNTPASMYYATKGSVDSELERSITGETYLFVIVFLAMAFITCLVLVKEWNVVDTRIGLAFSGIFAIVLAIGAGYGLNMAFGVPFTTVHQVLPFIIVGIGVDDMFIIVAAFDNSDEKLPTEERLAKALRRCGISILYTSVTDATAFFLGSISRIPAIHYFCLYAALVVVIDFIFQVTFFAAVLSLDAERRKQRRCDVFFCFRVDRSVGDVSPNKNAQYALGAPAESEGAVWESEDKNVGGSGNGDSDGDSHEAHHHKSQYNKVQQFISEIYVPFITTPIARIGIVAVFIGVLVMNIYAATKVDQGFEIIDLAPDDSYMRAYIDASDRLGLDGVLQLELVFKDNAYHEQSVQEEIIRVQTGMTGLYYISGPVSSWLSDFQAWVTTGAAYPYNNSVNADGYLTESSVFYPAVQDFVNVPQYAFYDKNVDFEYATPGDMSTLYIPASRVLMYQVNAITPMERVDAMDDARAYAKETDLNPHPIPYIQNWYMASETEAIIVMEMALNLALALTGVLFVSIFLLIKPLAVLLVGLVVACIDIDIIGTMHFWGLQVNIVSTMQCVMAIGLVIDYVAHVLHYYIREPFSKPPNQRLHDSLVEIGPSVLLGCTTTFCAIIPLAFGNNVIFRTFFEMFLSIILYGGGHGLILLPAILPLIPFGNDTKDLNGKANGTMDTSATREREAEMQEFIELDTHTKINEEAERPTSEESTSLPKDVSAVRVNFSSPSEGLSSLSPSGKEAAVELGSNVELETNESCRL